MDQPDSNSTAEMVQWNFMEQLTGVPIWCKVVEVSATKVPEQDS